MNIKILQRWLFFLAAILLSFNVLGRGDNSLGSVAVAELPRDAQITLRLIKENKPLPYAKDGGVFGNYEGLLPKQRRGYYREYTVKTPGARNRGARRIIAGGDWSGMRQYYYTDDHYNTFKRIRE